MDELKGKRVFLATSLWAPNVHVHANLIGSESVVGSLATTMHVLHGWTLQFLDMNTCIMAVFVRTDV